MSRRSGITGGTSGGAIEPRPTNGGSRRKTSRSSSPAPSFRPTRRCAIYTRKSSEEGLDQTFNSLDAQREACAAYVKSQSGEGWRALPALFDDGGFSGGHMDRPALQRLLAAIQRGEVDVVVVYKIDRLTRSLADFARMVELFDAEGVSFVSVTQAFNTTTSMGRLTLNVLLSFAQFEREVTGERIRDKIAASKQKGMWMGGMPPLGYDPPQGGSRALVVNEGEAETVRHIFHRYLHLGSVHALEYELQEQGLRSKAWVTRAGRQMGGLPFSRGALFHLLQSRTYRGEIVHRGESHPGLHPAIVDAELFAAVQVQLTANRRGRGAGASGRRQAARSAGPGTNGPGVGVEGSSEPVVGATTSTDRARVTAGAGARAAPSPLTGRIFDADGHPMSPAFTRGRKGKLYRYYVSAPLQQGKSCPETITAVRRLNASELEQTLAKALARLMMESVSAEGVARDPLALVQRVEVRRGEIRMWVLGGEQMNAPEDQDSVPVNLRDRLVEGETVDHDPRDPALLRVTLPFAQAPRGGATHLRKGAARSVAPDPTLIRALREAHASVTRDANGLPRIESAPASPYRRRLVRLAFLAPDLQHAILQGTQAPGLTLARLLEADLPLDWAEQRKVLGVA